MDTGPPAPLNGGVADTIEIHPSPRVRFGFDIGLDILELELMYHRKWTEITRELRSIVVSVVVIWVKYVHFAVV